MTAFRTRWDERVKFLVHVMNTLPGISTYTSCGGHRKVTNWIREYY